MDLELQSRFRGFRERLHSIDTLSAKSATGVQECKCSSGRLSCRTPRVGVWRRIDEIQSMLDREAADLEA